MMNTIWNMFVGVVIFVVGCSIILSTVKMIDAITKYFNGKSEYTIEKRVLNTVDTLVFIDRMIDIRLAAMADMQMVFRTPFNAMNLDDEVQKLAKEMHDSLTPELFKKNKEMMVDPAFLERYLVSVTTTKLMIMYKETNLKIAQMKAEDQQI